jgi:predicted ATPase
VQNRNLIFSVIALAFATLGALFLLLFFGMPFYNVVLSLVPLAMWLLYSFVRGTMPPIPQSSPLGFPQNVENIVTVALCSLALLTLAAIVYFPFAGGGSGMKSPDAIELLPLPLALLLFLDAARCVVALRTPATIAVAVPAGVATSPVEAVIPVGQVVIEQVEIENFKNLEKLKIDLARQSTLEGNWTCVAGINGAGKSTILQAICLILLGERFATELGGERLKRMLRRDGEATRDAKITATCRIGESRYTLFLPISADGVDEGPLRSHAQYAFMRTIWSSLQNQMFVSYGATRNLSERKDTRNENFSRPLQRQMTMFDPLTQVASADVLLAGGVTETNSTIVDTLEALLKAVFAGNEIGPATRDSANVLRFGRNSTSLSAIDLPDGYRSTVAWLADMCAAWHETAPSGVRRSKRPEDITGIVLVDEVDLHLHFRLQRDIIPRLRKALPKVQFIVTTHSPMILACFDRSELVILDQNSSEGQRELDRQLFGLTMDEIFEYLMGTKPSSPIIAELLDTDRARAAELLYQSANKSEAQAREELRQRELLLKRLQAGRVASTDGGAA